MAGYIITKNSVTEIENSVGIEIDLEIRNKNKHAEDMEYFIGDNPDNYEITKDGLVKLNENAIDELTQIKSNIARYEMENIRSSQEVLAAMLAEETPDKKESQAVILRRKIIALYRTGMAEGLASVQSEIEKTKTKLETIFK